MLNKLGALKEKHPETIMEFDNSLKDNAKQGCLTFKSEVFYLKIQS